MRLNPIQLLAANPARSAGFTLAEVLAALAFMAIVIPVAVEGLRISNKAGQVAERKAAALRVADRVLNETVATGQWRSASQNGTAMEGTRQYRWNVRSEPWREDAMRLVTVEVLYPVQGEDYDVRLSTVVDNASQ